MENSNQQATPKLPTQEDLEKNRVMLMTIGYANKEEFLKAMGEGGEPPFQRELVCVTLGGMECNKIQADHMIQTLLHILRTWGVEVSLAKKDGEVEFEANVPAEAANNATH